MEQVAHSVYENNASDINMSAVIDMLETATYENSDINVSADIKDFIKEYVDVLKAIIPPNNDYLDKFQNGLEKHVDEAIIAMVNNDANALDAIIADLRALDSDAIIENGNEAPEISGTPSINVDENSTYAFTPTAVDADGDNFTFTIINKPSWATFNTATGALTGTPSFDDAGTYNEVTIAVTDDIEADTLATFNITVLNVNRAPSATFSNFNTDEDLTYAGTLSGIDLDGDSVSYIKVNEPTYGTVAIDANGSFLYTPLANSFLNDSFSYKVNDGTLDSGIKTVLVVINSVNDAPVITSGNTVNVNENITSALTITATDADNLGTLSYSISGTDASSFDINSSTGAVTFKVAPDYENKTSYAFSAIASDGILTDTQAITVNIVNQNDVNPIITSSATVNVNENQTAVLTIIATDADNLEALSYSVSGTDASSFDINSSTGVVTFKVAPNYENKTSYAFNAVASDGALLDTETVTVNVNNVPDVIPTLSEFIGYVVEKSPAGTTVGNITLDEGDSAVISIDLNGTGSSDFVVSTTGLITVSNTASLDYKTNSVYNLTAIATNGVGVSGRVSVAINVDKLLITPLYSTDYGRELFISTENSQILIKDINAKLDSDTIQNIIAVGDILYFTANDGIHGRELWRSDGTPEGTLLVKDIKDGASDSSLYNLTDVNGILYFKCDDGIHGQELWKSDGTADGTVMVKDIYAGSSNSNLNYLTSFDDVLYFNATDGVNGYELWKSDGTEYGTVMVKDIWSGSNSGYPTYVVKVGMMIYFSATDGVNGYELWKSDGTADGTVMVKDIVSGSLSSNINGLANINGTLYFEADDGVHGDELWKSDGTADGTVMVKDIVDGSSNSTPRYFIDLNGVLFFSAYTSASGQELWKSDGTPEGTVIVKDIYAGSSGSNPYYYRVINDTLYFTANDGTHGQELWKSDGTPEGTVIVKDINIGANHSDVNYLTITNDILYFYATDGINGAELWKSDGTVDGTVMVKNALSGSAGLIPLYVENLNGTLYFTDNEKSLWTSDGTAEGTAQVKQINQITGSSIVNANNHVLINENYFFAATNDTNGSELWKSDGTADGTVMIKDIYSGANGSFPDYLTDINGTLFFSAQNDANGTELWKSNGTEAGTVMVKDISTGPDSSSPSGLTDINGTLYFSAYTNATQSQLWKSDGTKEGTIMINSGASSVRDQIINVNGVIYFIAYVGSNGGYDVWKSDGTDSGTSVIKEINLNYASAENLTEVNGTVYFTHNDGFSGTELWKTDGTADSTVMIKDIYSGINNSYPEYLTDLNNTLYFTADDGSGYKKLYRSNGNFNDTFEITGVDSDVSNLKAFKDKLLFWKADGNFNELHTLHYDNGNSVITKVQYDRPEGATNLRISEYINTSSDDYIYFTVIYTVGDTTFSRDAKSDGINIIFISDAVVGGGMRDA